MRQPQCSGRRTQRSHNALTAKRSADHHCARKDKVRGGWRCAHVCATPRSQCSAAQLRCALPQSRFVSIRPDMPLCAQCSMHAIDARDRRDAHKDGSAPAESSTANASAEHIATACVPCPLCLCGVCGFARRVRWCSNGRPRRTSGCTERVRQQRKMADCVNLGTRSRQARRRETAERARARKQPSRSSDWAMRAGRSNDRARGPA